MFVCLFISGFYLSDDRQDLYWLDIVDGHRLVFQRFDGQVLGLVFLNGTVLALHGKDDGACAWVFGCKVLGVVDDGGLALKDEFCLCQFCPVVEGNAAEQVGLHIYLKTLQVIQT